MATQILDTRYSQLLPFVCLVYFVVLFFFTLSYHKGPASSGSRPGSNSRFDQEGNPSQHSRLMVPLPHRRATPPSGANSSRPQHLFDRNATIINAYSGTTAAAVAALGHYAVESHAPAFYFTHPAGWDQHWKQGKCAYGCHGPVGWEMCWYDVAVGATSELLPKILGALQHSIAPSAKSQVTNLINGANWVMTLSVAQGAK